MSPSSPTTLYRVVSQTPDIQEVSTLHSDIDLDGEDSADASAQLSHALRLEDSKISWVLFGLGCAVLLPWNVMINAIPYFLSRLDGTSYRSTFTSYLSTSFTAAGFLFLAHATATSNQATSASWIFRTTIILSILTALLTFSTFIHLSPGIQFTFVLLNGIIQAAAGAYLQTAVVVVASLFGPSAMQTMMAGQAAVGVVVSGVQAVAATVSVWGLPDDLIATYKIDSKAEERSAFIFFGLSTLFLVCTIWANKWFFSSPAYRALAVPSEAKYEESFSPRNSEERQVLVSRGREIERSDKALKIMRVAKANIIYEIAVAFVFIITLSVFPPITVSIQSTNPHTHPLLFTAIHFLVFNTGDFLGRYVCAFPHLCVWSARRILGMSFSRVLFIPLFLACNLQRSVTSRVSSPVINSDFMFMLILLAFGLSNGYLASMCMMAAASLEHNPRLKGRKEDVDDAATVASFCLIGGLTLGSISSFAVRGAICGCNPFRD